MVVMRGGGCSRAVPGDAAGGRRWGGMRAGLVVVENGRCQWEMAAAARAPMRGWAVDGSELNVGDKVVIAVVDLER